MGIFNKIFGSQKQVAGDSGRSLVPVYLDSIALGAEPKTQVQRIRAIVGDSDPTFNEYLGELEMAGDEKPEVIKKAVDIVSAYYKEHLAGDEFPPKDDDKKSKEEKEEKKPAGDEEKKPDDKEKKEAGDEEKKPEDDKKSAGDGCGKLSGDELDAIADKVAARMLAAQSKAEPKKEEIPAAGDELTMPLGGDSVNKEVHTSDDFIKDIWG